MKKTNDSIEQALTDREKPIKEFNLEDIILFKMLEAQENKQ